MPKPGFFVQSQTPEQTSALLPYQALTGEQTGLMTRSNLKPVTREDYIKSLVSWSIAVAASGIVYTFLTIFGVANETLFMAFMETLALASIVASCADYTQKTKDDILSLGVKLAFVGLVVYGCRDTTNLSLGESILCSTAIGLFTSMAATYMGQYAINDLIEHERSSSLQLD